MSYSIEVARSAKDEILRFPFSILDDVVEQLDRLGESPDLGVRIDRGPLGGRMLFSFRVERLPLVFHVGVLYLYTQDEETLFITDFGLVQEGFDGPRLVDI